MIPEGLYLLASVALAVSSIRLAQKKVLLHDMKCIETLARVDVLCVDKTGTITYGNRLAADFRPVKGIKKEDLIDYAVMTSLCDATPEGKSVVELGKTLGTKITEDLSSQMEFIEFTAQTKMSGVNLKDGTPVRKGAYDAILYRLLRRTQPPHTVRHWHDGQNCL